MVDYWALGILIYEMLQGYSPFADDEENNQLTVYKNIVRGEVVFSSRLRDQTGINLVMSLLVANPSQVSSAPHACVWVWVCGCVGVGVYSLGWRGIAAFGCWAQGYQGHHEPPVVQGRAVEGAVAEARATSHHPHRVQQVRRVQF